MMRDNIGTSYVYEAENRISTARGFTYVYDADGNRVQKINANTTPATGTLYWYMSAGIVAESDLSGNLQSEYVFFDGKRVARNDDGKCNDRAEAAVSSVQHRCCTFLERLRAF